MKSSGQILCCILCLALTDQALANAQTLIYIPPPPTGKVLTPVGTWQGQMKNEQPLRIQFDLNSNCVSQVQDKTVINGVQVNSHWNPQHRHARFGHLRYTLPGQRTHYSVIHLDAENNMRISWKGEMVTLKPVRINGERFKIVDIQTLPFGAIHFPIALHRPAVAKDPNVKSED